MYLLQGKTSDLPSGLTAWDVNCLALYSRNTTWTPDVIRSMPLRHWKWLPVMWAAVAEMQNPDRPGNN
jgi:hypothetical protein